MDGLGFEERGRVAIKWPPCGSARLGLTASQAGATPYHLTTTR